MNGCRLIVRLTFAKTHGCRRAVRMAVGKSPAGDGEDSNTAAGAV